MNVPVLPARTMTGNALGEPVLVVAGLHKTFFDREVLAMLDFSWAPGQSTALIGAHGWGKWQRHILMHRLSALSNVVHGLQARLSGAHTWFRSVAPSVIRKEAMAYLARAGLVDRATARLCSMSGGQQQRLAFGLADEPNASLDPQKGKEGLELLLGQFRLGGLPLLVVSHRLEHTLACSDRVLGHYQGRIALDLPTSRADAAARRRFFDPEVAA